MKKWCEVFKSGTHTDASGNTKTWTTDDLDNIVTQFMEQGFSAPVVVGHPKLNCPAYGWLDSLKREGESLFASFKNVVPEFAEAVNKGVFKNRSISLYPDGKVRHIGFLGGFQPAIKGLEDFQFAEDDTALVYEFASPYDRKFENVGDFFQSIREFLIEKYDIETADKVIWAWRIDDLKRAVSTDEVVAYAETFVKKEDVSDSDFAEKDTEKDTEKDQEIQRLQQELDAERAQARKQGHEQFAEGLLSQGKILPHQKPAVIDFMECAHNLGTFDFSEGEEKSVLTRFKDFLNGVKQVEFSEVATETGTGKSKTPIEFSDGKEAAEAIKRVQRESLEKDGVELDPVKALKKAKGE